MYMYMYMYFEVRKFSVRMPVQLYLKLLRLQGTLRNEEVPIQALHLN